ncbi:DUF982 domain-containing protein [Acidimangrovimonas sediminis]|uniref:DUF982 domain-containing protein n=1 Tax=Acidimangrovimonas sediminis TaxID=2056283 RepID=UPI001E4CD12B|nr:DUF982 domain-containing protein [Acidimangrovimonas sediminis]
MIEIHWGAPMALSTQDEATRISTIEQAQYWLKQKWPVADRARDVALSKVAAAMDCLVPVSVARQAFLSAATTAGFRASVPGAPAGARA